MLEFQLPYSPSIRVIDFFDQAIDFGGVKHHILVDMIYFNLIVRG